MAQVKENIVLFPFMAQGHIIPFLALALRLEQTQNYFITFVNTPLNVKRIRPLIPSNSSIRLVEIPFDVSGHGLPSGTENTDSLPYHLIVNLLEASMSLKPAFKKLISDLVHEQNGGRRPLCIVTGMFFGWCAEIAHQFGIYHAIFVAGGGFGFACYYSLWLNLPHRNARSDKFTLPDFPEASVIDVTQMPDYLRVADGSDAFSRFLRKVLPEWSNADAVLVNTVEEFDKVGLTYLRRKIGRPIWPIGPVLLPTSRQTQTQTQAAGIKLEDCKKWLDAKPPKSVLYISFGSQNTISASQMIQLAMALETSGKDFIWVVRPPIGFDINSEFKAKEWLPEGFEDRIRDSGKGILVQKWAPQMEILSHESISAFLSHCGWNSVLESLSHGIPILGWPMAAEQFYNVKLLEEIGVCVEAARGKSCQIRCYDIVAKIEMVMNDGEKGKGIRKMANEVRGMIEDASKDNKDGFMGSSVEAMNGFLNAAVLMQVKTKMESFYP